MPVKATTAAMAAAGVEMGLSAAWYGPQGALISNDEVAEFVAQSDGDSARRGENWLSPRFACRVVPSMKLLSAEARKAAAAAISSGRPLRPIGTPAGSGAACSMSL